MRAAVGTWRPALAAIAAAVTVAAGAGCADRDAPDGSGGRPTAPDAAPDRTRPTARWCPRQRAGDETRPAPRRLDVRRLIGLTLPEARERAAAAGCTVRVVVRDGRHLPHTKDLRPDRVNVAVRDGVVRGVESVG